MAIRPMGRWQLTLNSCHQNFRENISSYSSRIENCYIKLINSLDETMEATAKSACINLLKTQVLNIFMNGLQKDIALVVKSQNPTDLEEAI